MEKETISNAVAGAVGSQKRHEQDSTISNSITSSWTLQAVECYSVGSDCSQCSLGAYTSFVCQMPKVVDILINKFGEPIANAA